MPDIEDSSFHIDNKDTNLHEQRNDSAKSDEYDSFVMNSDRIGAKVLAQVNYEDRHKETTDVSHEETSKSDEEKNAKPSEKRSIAYVRRLEDLINKYGSSIERRLWRKSAKKLVISPDDIPDSYWEQQDQKLRDRGQGDIKINEDEKYWLTNDIIRGQRESLESWSDYLGDEDCPFPMWFKVYAWDGMSKMGAFDREKKCFEERDEQTIAPYPELNPSALAKVYELILDFYGRGDSDDKTDTEIMDDELQALVASGNFNKLYSKMLLSEKKLVETPASPEDVVGEWVEYLPGDEEKLAEAAQDTPWDISTTRIGKAYLQYRNTEKDGKAKFILFHLTDPETGSLSESACVSIRLDTNGMVAEVSGLGEGQVVEDALLPTVIEKIKSLPGGEEFAEALIDNNKLVYLDYKMKNGEDLTKEELEFIFEINRPIKSLRKCGSDPRISDLKYRFWMVESALEAGVDPEKLIQHIDEDEIVSHITWLTKYGVSIDHIVSMLSPSCICASFDWLKKHGANIDLKDVAHDLSPEGTIRYLDTLIEHEVPIDFVELINNLDEDTVEGYSTRLISHGVNIQDIATKLDKSVKELLSEMDRPFILDNLEGLLDSGVDINDIILCLGPDYLWYEFDTILDHNPDVDLLLGTMEDVDIIEKLKNLLDHDISVEKILPYINGFIISQDDVCKTLIDHGASIDNIAEMIANDRRMLLYDAVRVLAENGADLRKIISKVDKSDKRVLELLRQYGVEIQ